MGRFSTAARGNADVGDAATGYLRRNVFTPYVQAIGIGSMGNNFGIAYPLGRSSQYIVAMLELIPPAEPGLQILLKGDVPSNAFRYIHIIDDQGNETTLLSSDAVRNNIGVYTNFVWPNTGVMTPLTQYEVLFDRITVIPPPEVRSVLQHQIVATPAEVMGMTIANPFVVPSTESWNVRFLISRIETGHTAGEFTGANLLNNAVDASSVSDMKVDYAENFFPNRVNVGTGSGGGGGITCLTSIPVDGSEWTYLDITSNASSPASNTEAFVNGAASGQIAVDDVGWQVDKLWQDLDAAILGNFNEPWMWAGIQFLNIDTGEEVIWLMDEGTGTAVANSAASGATYDGTLVNENWITPELPPPDFEPYVP